MKLPISYLGSVLSSVLFPAVSRIQHDIERVQSVYIQAIGITTLLTLPMMIYLGVYAPEVVVGLYGSEWEGTVRPLQILAAFGVFRTIYHVAAAFAKAMGNIYRLSLFQFIYAVSVVGGSWVGAQLGGIEGVAWAVGGAIILMYVMVTSLVNKTTGLTWQAFFRAHISACSVAVVFSLSAILTRYSIVFLPIPELGVAIVGGLLTVGLTLVVLNVLPDRWTTKWMAPIEDLIRLRVVPPPVLPWLHQLLPLQSEVAVKRREKS